MLSLINTSKTLQWFNEKLVYVLNYAVFTAQVKQNLSQYSFGTIRQKNHRNS